MAIGNGDLSKKEKFLQQECDEGQREVVLEKFSTFYVILILKYIKVIFLVLLDAMAPGNQHCLS